MNTVLIYCTKTLDLNEKLVFTVKYIHGLLRAKSCFKLFC